MTDITENSYQTLVDSIGTLLEQGRAQAVQKVNTILVDTYWHVGWRIVEYEQAGQIKAEYGKELLLRLSKDLKAHYGKGFSRSNLQYMRLLYTAYPKRQTLSGKSKAKKTWPMTSPPSASSWPQIRMRSWWSMPPAPSPISYSSPSTSSICRIKNCWRKNCGCLWMNRLWVRGARMSRWRNSQNNNRRVLVWGYSLAVSCRLCKRSAMDFKN